MKKEGSHIILKIAFVLFSVFIVIGCSSSKVKYEREYARVWKELIQSQAWKDALATKNGNADEVIILKDQGSFKEMESPWFKERYASLVSRAYFKIITEAEDADKRLQEDYEYWTAKSKDATVKDRKLKKRLELVNKKYEAHNSMLLGLKSWNIFSEDKSGDLEYFKAENEEAIYKMYLQGLEEKTMISYLVFKLADLYHFEE